MKYGYTADEVFEIAEDIEREGQNFYTCAAEHAQKKKVKELFAELSETCGRHVEALRAARTNVVDNRDESLIEHPDMSISLYLRTVARGAVYDPPERVDRVLKECETEDDILELAINKELDAMLYFSEMQDLIETNRAKKAVDEVVKQKRKHVVALSSHRHEEEDAAPAKTD